ncbi:MAG: hypothetical protein SGBAC_004964 [Bacillariaceae sp.]
MELLMDAKVNQEALKWATEINDDCKDSDSNASSMSTPKLNPSRATLFSIAATVAAVYTVSAVVYGAKKKKQLPDGARLPPHWKSYVPYIGSGLQLVSGLARDFITETAKKLNAPVFTATINGAKCLFIADSDLAFVVFKQIPEIDSMSLQRQALLTLSGIDPATAEEIVSDKEVQKRLYGQLHKYFLQTDELSKTTEAAQRVIWKILEATNLSTAGGEWKSFNLFEFSRDFVFFASAGPVISNGLETQEQLLEIYSKFEEGIPLLFADAPSFLTKESAAAREQLVQILMTPEVDKGLSEYFKERKDLYGHSPEVLARMNVGMFIATVSNSIPAVFWVLCHLLHTPNALEACIEEVKQVANTKANQEDLFSLEELDKMPLLHSCFKESLRMYQCTFNVRSVAGDFILNPKEKDGPKYLIEKGTRMMGYTATAHMDPSIFENPETFQYDRFLDPTKKALNGKRLSSYWRPFGGGAHLCPGRKYISYEARAFLATLLLKVDIKLDDPREPIPTIALHRQGFSVAHPNKDPKFLVKVKDS